jgi:hypothetical protein
MAKQLPYFKFEPNEWENGNIQICSREEKGLFMDLCAIYWSRLGDLPEKLAIQKLCGGNASELNTLYEEEIIEVKDGFICIHFLNEQLLEFEDTSKQNRENARKGWEKRRKKKPSERNAGASKPQSETDAIKENKIKENKSIKDNIIERENKFRFTANTFQNEFELDLIDSFCNYWTEPNQAGTKMKFELQKTFEIKRRLITWNKNQIKFNQNGTGNQKGRKSGTSDFFSGSTEGVC